MKRLWVIAGPNGSGKTTITSSYIKNNIPIINPDVIAKQISNNDFNEMLILIKAGKVALAERKRLLKAKNSFAIETTLSGKQELAFMTNAKQQGFKIYLIYIATSSYNISIGRIIQRIKQGGHSVNPIDVERRYNRSLQNLSKAMQISDKTVIINNDERPKLVMTATGGKIHIQSKILPVWVSQNIPYNLK